MGAKKTEPTLEELLVRKERSKWEALVSFGEFPETLFTNDFVSIAFVPSGAIRSRTPEGRELAAIVPKGAYELDDFRVIKLTPTREHDGDSAIVTYRITGPLPLYATSVWVKRNERWQTVFFQATPAGRG